MSLKGEDVLNINTAPLLYIVPYGSETQKMVLGPKSVKIHYGLCKITLLNGSFEMTHPLPGYSVIIENGFIKQDVFRIESGESGCTYSLDRPYMRKPAY